METTDFEDILREAAEEVSTLDPEALDPAEFRALRRSARKRLEVAWEFHYWPVLTRMEQRFYRADWDAAASYEPGDEVYFPQTQKYYLVLQPVSGQEPADSNGLTDQTYYEVASPSYEADTFDITASYEFTDRVAYGDQVYQLFVAGPVVGVLPTDDSQWGLLVPFDKYIAYEQTGKTAIGLVDVAWSANPRTTTRGNELNWFLSENGVQVLTPINFAWLDYRIRCPKLSGETFDTAATYTAGQQVYFSSTSVPGNFYIANSTTSAGQSPASAASKWDVVQIPKLFHKYLVMAVAADWVRGPGGGDPQEAAFFLSMAQAALDDQKSLLVGQQSQRIKTVVRTR